MRLYLIDGTYELFRSYFGAPKRRTSDGREAGAVHGIVGSTLRLLAEDGVTHVAAAFDSVIESFRNEIYPLVTDTLIRIFDGGPTGVEAIAHTMNIACDTLQDEVEPFLLRSELIVRTPRGRMANVKAFEHLKMTPPKDSDNDSQGALFE